VSGGQHQILNEKIIHPSNCIELLSIGSSKYLLKGVSKTSLQLSASDIYQYNHTLITVRSLDCLMKVVAIHSVFDRCEEMEL